MTDRVTTSEIAVLLDHKSAAATRSWIRNHKLEAKSRDTVTGEKQYSRTEVEQAIASMPRGPYEKTRPDKEPPHGPLPDQPQ